MNCDLLKAELTKINNNPYRVTEAKQDKRVDYDAGGSFFSKIRSFTTLGFTVSARSLEVPTTCMQ